MRIMLSDEDVQRLKWYKLWCETGINIYQIPVNRGGSMSASTTIKEVKKHG